MFYTVKTAGKFLLTILFALFILTDPTVLTFKSAIYQLYFNNFEQCFNYVLAFYPYLEYF